MGWEWGCQDPRLPKTMPFHSTCTAFMWVHNLKVRVTFLVSLFDCGYVLLLYFFICLLYLYFHLIDNQRKTSNSIWFFTQQNWKNILSKFGENLCNQKIDEKSWESWEGMKNLLGSNFHHFYFCHSFQRTKQPVINVMIIVLGIQLFKVNC